MYFNEFYVNMLRYSYKILLISHDIFCLNSMSILTSFVPSEVGEYIFSERLNPVISFFVIAIVMYPAASNPFRQLFNVR